MNNKAFTPALGFRALTPLYDSVVALLTRENTWREALVRLIAPQPHDRILDVGCGTGSLLARLALSQPDAELIGIDPDPAVLAIARRKFEKLGLRASWIEGFLDDAAVASIGNVTKVVSSLVFHQTPLCQKQQVLTYMRAVLETGSSLYIADYGEQRSRTMRLLFRLTVQLVDGVTDTQPNADGRLPELIREAGFRKVRVRRVIPTVTGAISLFEASAG